MFYITKNNELKNYNDVKRVLENTLRYTPELAGEPIRETDIVTSIEYQEEPYKVIVQDNVLVLNPDYEAEKQARERARLDALSLTAADVERAIYKDKGMDFDDLVTFASSVPGIDIKALKIELRANNFFRNHPYINQLGTLLGYTSDDLDYLFEHKEFKTNE